MAYCGERGRTKVAVIRDTSALIAMSVLLQGVFPGYFTCTYKSDATNDTNRPCLLCMVRWVMLS